MNITAEAIEARPAQAVCGKCGTAGALVLEEGDVRCLHDG